ncbi:MAG: hypothetical protein GY928_16435 [Colwellia sp.]|nr:hypothetical protein [Colwellia sp.]
MSLLDEEGGGGFVNIFVVDITSPGNVNITKKDAPNDEVVASVKLEDNTATVSIEWDRAGNYEGLPTVNGVEVTKDSKIGGSTYTGHADISGEYLSITASYADSSHVVPLETLDKPVISLATFSGSYPAGQTELKAGDTYNIDITCDVPYTTVETQSHEACISKSFTTSGSIAAVIAGRGNVAVERIGRVRVKNAAGTWSDWTDTNNTVNCNNLHPAVTITNKAYPGSQLALKDSEEIVIAYTVTDSDSDIESATGNLTLTANGATRASGNYENGTYTITSTRDANGAVTVHNEAVRIAHVDVDFTSNVPVQVRSGVGAVLLPLTFTQDLLTPISSPSITATDSDTHSLTTLYSQVTVTNLAGKTINLDRAYYIKGFALKTLVLDWPNEQASIGTDIVTASDVTVTGVINSTPPYDICTNRVTSGNIVLVGDYVLNTNNVEIDKQLCAEFNYDSSNNITIYIEET